MNAEEKHLAGTSFEYTQRDLKNWLIMHGPEDEESAESWFRENLPDGCIVIHGKEFCIDAVLTAYQEMLKETAHPPISNKLDYHSAVKAVGAILGKSHDDGIEKIAKAMLVLMGEGIDEDQAEVVLQAIGYTLLDAELFPDGFDHEALETKIQELKPDVLGNSDIDEPAVREWIQIWYSWGEQESPVEVPQETDAWEHAMLLAAKEATIENHEHGECGEVGLFFDKGEGKITLHYPHDDEYCYFLITDTEDYEPENEED